MKLRFFLGGLLIGIAIGLMLGGYMVKISEDGTDKRYYPQGVALLMALVGGAAVGSALRAVPNRPQLDSSQ